MNDHEVDDENDREEPDWEELAAEAERAEKMGQINAIATRIINSTSLNVSQQPPDTRLVVSAGYQVEDDPQTDMPVEFTILDPACLKVLVMDPKNFPEPPEGILLATPQMNGTVTAPGQVKRLDRFIYEVDGMQ